MNYSKKNSLVTVIEIIVFIVASKYLYDYLHHIATLERGYESVGGEILAPFMVLGVFIILIFFKEVFIWLRGIYKYKKWERKYKNQRNVPK